MHEKWADDYIEPMNDDAPKYGTRIRALRARRGWTQAQASELMGFRHRQSLAAVEAGSRGLSAQELVRAAAAFGIDVARLSDPYVVTGEAEFCWRRSPNVTPGEIERVEMEVGRVFGAYRHLRRRLGVEHRPMGRETGLAPKSDEAEAASAGEALARELWSAEPADGLAIALEERLGIAVLNMDLPYGVSGVACRMAGLDGIAVNRNEATGRRSFNMAHELFHLLTWARMPPDRLEDASQSRDRYQEQGVAPPQAGDIASVAESSASDAKAHVEELADAFAAGLLMPRIRLERIAGFDRLPEGDDGISRWLNDAATSMEVSSMALGRRLVSLGRLPEPTLTRLLRSRRLTHNGANPTEPPPRYGKAFVGLLIRGTREGVLPMEAATNIPNLEEGELSKLARDHGLAAPSGARDGWEEARAWLSRWAGHADGWDGEDSLAPSQTSLEHAGEFAGEAERRGIAPPEPRLYGDGEVEFGWRKDRASASVSFLGDGHVVAYIRRATRRPMLKLDHPFAKATDLGDLLDALREAF